MSSPELVDLQCKNCGAELPPPVNGRVACRYCGRAYEVSRPPPPPPPQPAIRPSGPSLPVRRYPQPVKPVRGITRVVNGIRAALGILFLAFAVIGVLRSKFRSPVPSASGVFSVPSVGNIFPSPSERHLWDDVGGPPQPASTPSGEAFVGRFRIGDKDQLFVVATDSTTLAERWRVGPLGSYSEGYQATHFAVVGSRVLISDYHSVLHQIDVASGKELSVARLTDRAKQICALPGAREAWVQVEDGQNVIVDASTAKARAAVSRPSACPQNSWSNRTHSARARDLAGAEAHAPAVPNFQSDHVLVDGSNAVAAGYKSPGTRLPLLVGFDVRAKQATWQVPLETGDPSSMQPSSHLADDLAGGRYLVAFDTVSSDPHLVAFDASSGKRWWDVALPKQRGIENAADLVASASRVYVVRSNNLEVFDAAKGTFLGRVGSAWLAND